MKLLAIFILYKENENEVKILQNEFNLDSISRFKRGQYDYYKIINLNK
jgi:hypothetical protein